MEGIFISAGLLQDSGLERKGMIGMKPPFAYWPTEAIDHNTVAFKSILKGKEGTAWWNCPIADATVNALMPLF